MTFFIVLILLINHPVLLMVFSFLELLFFQNSLMAVAGNESADNLGLIAENSPGEAGWMIYLVSLLLLVVLYFLQKYAYLIDRKLNQYAQKEKWEGKPWPLISGLLLGIYTFLYNLFSREGMQVNPVNWQYAEWLLVVAFIALFSFLAIESLSHYGTKYGIIRMLILILLVLLFYFSGLYAGLIIAALIALFVLIFFMRFWYKKLILK